MRGINSAYGQLPPAFFFSRLTKTVSDYAADHPDRRLLRLANSDSGKTIEKKVKAFHLVNAAELASKYRNKNEDLLYHYTLTKVELIPGTYRTMTKDDLEDDPVSD